MNIIAKTIIGKEYCYNNSTSILCKSEKQARELADFMNKNDKDTIGAFKLKSGECWHAYTIDKYSAAPVYRLVSTSGKISINLL